MENFTAKFLLVKTSDADSKGPPRILARNDGNDYGPMMEGETRTFYIDKTKKKDCKLPVSNLNMIKIEITKERSERSPNDAFTFRMVSMKGIAHNPYIDCYNGYISQLRTFGGSENCGIGKILMQLCLNEETIHNVKNRLRKNKAFTELNKFHLNNKDDTKTNKLNKFGQWASKHCSKFVYLVMDSEPRSKAHVFFNSAIESGFTKMFMIKDNLKPGTKLKFYPIEGPCNVNTLQDLYSDDGKIGEIGCGLKRTKVWGWNWFFCLPIVQPPNVILPKCTIL